MKAAMTRWWTGLPPPATAPLSGTILKLDLPDCRIVQDRYFSLGGASGRTGKSGEADPIETHVYLETGESAETTQEMHDISEQTGFLHAFCRTDLKTKLKVERV